MFMGRKDDEWPAPKGNLGEPWIAEALAALKARLERFREEVYKSSSLCGGKGGATGRADSRSDSSGK